ncbi:helix-turn-helix transcriptional regulator [Rhodanobacter sp. UC4436_H3]
MQPLPVHSALPETGYLRLPQVLAVFPVSRSTWWAGVRAGRYPKPVQLGARCTAWHVDEIRALIEATRQGEAHDR